MDRQQLCGSLIAWLNTFNCFPPSEKPEELADGVAMSKVLNQIAPQFFDEAWMSKLKLDTNSNWRLKVSNLKKILKGILDFYSEVLGQQIQDFHMPNVTAVGETNDIVELSRLLQLILGCAVNCEDKQEYIQRIMGMEESVQHMVMQAIQELMTKETPASTEGHAEVVEQLKKTVEELNKAVEEKEEIAQRCHELDLQIAALHDEKASLEQDNERLTERVLQADSLDDPSSPAGRRYQQIHSQVEQLQEELYKQEAGKEDLRIKVELQDREMLDLHQKNEELTALAEEARTLKDEVDVLRHTADKVAKYEASIESYKKKLEELSDLKGQIKILEEKNTNYMQTNIELEEEARKLGTFKTQLDVYKRQVQELQIKSSEEIKRADKAEFESKRLHDKMSTISREKERLSEENISLNETIEELRGTRAQQDTMMGEGDADLDGSSKLWMSSLPPEIKEQFIRLQHENKMLRLQKSSTDEESSQVLQNMLDDANARKNELETEVRILNQRILELNAQLEDLQESQEKVTASQDSSSAELRNKLSEQINKCKHLDNELQQKRTALEETEPRISQQEDSIKRLEQALEKKNDEMKAMEERYKKYLEKAKGVSSFSQKRGSGAPLALDEPDSRDLRDRASDGIVRSKLSRTDNRDRSDVDESMCKRSSKLYEFESTGPPNVKITCVVESNEWESSTRETDVLAGKSSLTGESIHSLDNYRESHAQINTDKPTLSIVPSEKEVRDQVPIYSDSESSDCLFEPSKVDKCRQLSKTYDSIEEPAWERMDLVTSSPKRGPQLEDRLQEHENQATDSSENNCSVQRRIQGACSNPEFYAPFQQVSATPKQPVEASRRVASTRVMDEWYKPQNESPQSIPKVSSLNDLSNPFAGNSVHNDLLASERKRIQELEALLLEKTTEVDSMSQQFKHFYDLKIHALQHESNVKMKQQEKEHKERVSGLEKDLKRKEAEYQELVTDAKHYISKLEKNSVSGLGIVCDLLFRR